MSICGAVIGGTGIGEKLAEFGGTPIHVPTPTGCLRGVVAQVGSKRILLLRRHSNGHKVPPHKVDYASMAHGLKQLRIPWCLATAAVGSLRDEWKAGHLAICSGFIDLTFRNQTLFDRTVIHTDFTNPFSSRVREAMKRAASNHSIAVSESAVYVGGNGPRYETPEEVQAYRHLGGDVVGMTATTEAILMREAGIEYGCLAIVTNLASGISPTPLTHQEVVDEMNRSSESALTLLTATADLL